MVLFNTITTTTELCTVQNHYIISGGNARLATSTMQCYRPNDIYFLALVDVVIIFGAIVGTLLFFKSLRRTIR